MSPQSARAKNINRFCKKFFIVRLGAAWSLQDIPRFSGYCPPWQGLINSGPAPIHEGPWGSETSAKRLPRGCLNLAAALRPTLPLTPKGPSSGVDAPCGDFEDNKGLSGPTGKKHK